MKSCENQLEIEGIGQQLFDIDIWKKNNGIFTFKSGGMPKFWSAWNEIEDPVEFLNNYGGDAFGYGDSEKEAIIEFCEIEKIEIPFHWK